MFQELCQNTKHSQLQEHLDDTTKKLEEAYRVIRRQQAEIEELKDAKGQKDQTTAFEELKGMCSTSSFIFFIVFCHCSEVSKVFFLHLFS